MGFVMEDQPTDEYGRPLDAYGRPLIDEYGNYVNDDDEEYDYGYGYNVR